MCYRDWANKATWVSTKLGPTAATLEAMLGNDKFFCGGAKPTVADFVICEMAPPAPALPCLRRPVPSYPAGKRVHVTRARARVERWSGSDPCLHAHFLTLALGRRRP